MPAFNSVEELKAHRAIPVNFGWVVPGRVAGMASPTSPDQLAHLRAHLGVALVINLTEVPLHRRGAAMLGELAPSVFHMPLPDQYNTILEPEVLDPIVLEMQMAVARGEVVAVHCCGGLGRTGVVLACYLVAERGLSAVEAIKAVRDRRPQSLVVRKQELAVHRFAAYLDDKAARSQTH